MVDWDKNTARRFWISLVLMALFGALNVVFSYLNYAERAEMRREAGMTREMLNARAMIQIILITAVGEGRSLTLVETQQINRLWVTAEFDTEKRANNK